MENIKHIIKVIRFDDDNVASMLESLLANSLPHSNDEAIDHLYHPILRELWVNYFSVLEQAKLQKLFAVLINSPQPTTLLSISHATGLPLDYIEDGSKTIIGALQRSGLIVQDQDEQTVSLFRVHPSLEDFLTKPPRCEI